MEARERDLDSELVQAEFDDAEPDHALATKPAQMPADLRGGIAISPER
jgi:hypothetical protein